MSSITSVSPRTLADVIPGGVARSVALVVGGAAFVGLTAQVFVPLPFSPVPLSLQTFSVLLVGAVLGSRRGAASMGLYLVAGVAGVPWFTQQQSGWAFASFGYVVGFVLAAYLVGRLAEQGADRTVLRSVGLMVCDTPEHYEFLARKCARERELGLDVEMLDRAALRRIAPYLAEAVHGAEFCADEGKLNPLLCNAAIRRWIRARGVVLAENVAVEAIQRSGAAFDVRTSIDSVRAGRVVARDGELVGGVGPE